MESLSDTEWDVVISGTGLQHSLLALALSRSAKNILHVDEGDYYGGAEAALSLPELDAWVAKHHHGDGDGDGNGNGSNGDEDGRVFSAARVAWPSQDEGAPQARGARGYSIALAPQLIHARAALLSQLVSSKAFRQVEFLAVGSFFVYQARREPESPESPESTGAQEEGAEGNALHRIPSTREDVFSNAAIPVRAKRALMKFLKFVLEHDSSDAHAALWRPRADEPLAAFLASEFRLDAELQAYVVALTLSLDGAISVVRGLAAIHRHLASTGVFGPGFAAVYPKWGGLAEIAQVGCRAAAVGGAVYMLGVGVADVRTPGPEQQQQQQQQQQLLGITLTNDVAVKAKRLVHTTQPAPGAPRLTRLTAAVHATLPSLFQPVVDGAPTPSVAVVAFPAGCSLEGSSPAHPVYAMVHSADTGECPAGQCEYTRLRLASIHGRVSLSLSLSLSPPPYRTWKCVVYLSTLSSPTSREILAKALAALLSALPDTKDRRPDILFQLCYEQKGAPARGTAASAGARAKDGIFAFDLMPLDLAFDDAVLEPVRDAWDWITDGSSDERGEYMNFKDREGVDEDDSAE
ncbi:Rab proteins geranylgeranyltransferase component A [Escovopsis weberi]|uniref:Rab proteins geranylgeranyltransferase n=1 Tax=Escovopsis weberi TaxID=150374 RepID=A0A0M9VV86_ESCWE|nr:Rab proteins geranylgeranyltransferase component A [Escovopsis weberi]